MRIVSLLASATEIVCALDAGDRLVGRSHECDNPRWVRSLPACSEPAFDVSVSSREINAEVNRRLRAGEPLYHLRTEMIRHLAPDLVIAQSHCDVCAITPQDLSRGGGAPLAPAMLSLTAGSLAGIFADIDKVAVAIDLRRNGERLIARERSRLDRVRAVTVGFRRPTLVMLEWTDPVFAMGNWGPELVEIANGELLLGEKGELSHSISFEQVLASDPEFLIIAPCGFSLERACQERCVLESYPGWNRLRAVREGKVAIADGNLYFNRSGMTIGRTAELIAEIIHGITFPQSTTSAEWRWLRS